MGKSTDKTLKQMTYRKSKEDLNDMFKSYDPDADIEIYFKAKKQRLSQQKRALAIKSKIDGEPL
jgi:hypothetical protein